MNTIKLKTLTLENWRGQNISLNFHDGINEIRAFNGRGKSTLFNAWLWLLTGADSEDKTNVDLFDTHNELSKDTPVAQVEAIVEKNGSTLKLKRCAKSQWTRPRSKDVWVKATSDKYTFFVDDVEYAAKQYQDVVSELFDGQDMAMIKMVCNPLQSSNMEWKELRKMFQRIIGEIKPSDYSGDYSAITDAIVKHGFDIAKQGVMNRVNDLKKSHERIKLDIAAKVRTLPDLSQCDEAERQIDVKKSRIAEIDAEISGVGEANKPYIEKRAAEEDAIQKKRQEIAHAHYEFDFKEGNTLRDAENNYRELLSQNREIAAYNAKIASNIARLDKEIISVKGDVKYLTELDTELHAQNNAVKARQFDANLICPVCGQTLPYEQIESAREKFYAQKELEHERIVKRGVENKAKKEEREARLAELEQQKLEYVPKAELDLTTAKAEVERARASQVQFKDTELCAKLNAELAELENSRTEIPDATDVSELQAEKDKLLNEIQTLSKIIGYRDIYAEVKADIDEKKREENATTSAMAQEESLLFKFIEYERERASIISCRVNQYLKVAKVRILQQNKNGDYTDCCTITVDSVGTTSNRASKIAAGVDVAHAFQQYLGLQAPLFIDDCDAIAPQLIPVNDGQQIRLIFDVDYLDKPLTLI